jgi:hypothetical protein
MTDSSSRRAWRTGTLWSSMPSSCQPSRRTIPSGSRSRRLIAKSAVPSPQRTAAGSSRSKASTQTSWMRSWSRSTYASVAGSGSGDSAPSASAKYALPGGA